MKAIRGALVTVVLVGMSGCGSATVSEDLAKKIMPGMTIEEAGKIFGQPSKNVKSKGAVPAFWEWRADDGKGIVRLYMTGDGKVGAPPFYYNEKGAGYMYSSHSDWLRNGEMVSSVSVPLNIKR